MPDCQLKTLALALATVKEAFGFMAVNLRNDLLPPVAQILVF